MGGSELTVFRLVQEERRRGLDSRVLSLKSGGSLGRRFEDAKIPTRALNIQDGLGALARWVWPGRNIFPPFDIVDGWLYSGNLMAGILSRGWPGSSLVWNLMQANISPAVNGAKTRFLMASGARFSGRWPDRIVCNSEAAKMAHEGIGYDSSKMTVIPNGVGTDCFQPNPEIRAQFRREWHIPSDSIVLGHLARWDPQKDHRSLVEAFALLVGRGVNAQLFMAGPGVTNKNPLLMKWIQETGLSERFHLLGPIDDAPHFLAGLDIFCLSSVGESSSYALAEAMACGVPAVVTDVGDSRALLGESGVVVAPSDPEAFCQGLHRLASMGVDGRSRLGQMGRDRIVRDYSFQKMVDAYQALYRDIIRVREK